ncbi:hypothetical protein DXG01_014594 [Tephrocybe rancida]|nr:hypothetical protein DXG01_014594 [Tephrocybe rancida]
MMITFASPSIDINNPFYCPAVPAASYIKSLQNQVHRKTRSRVQSRINDRLAVSFVRVLEHALLMDTYDSSDDNYGQTTSTSRLIAHQRSPGSSSSGDEAHSLSATIPLWEREDGQDSWNQVHVTLKKRKRDSFSDIRGPPQYAKSLLSAHDSSFDVSVKREKLSYSEVPGSPIDFERAAPGIRDDISMLTIRVRDLEGEVSDESSKNRTLDTHAERLFGPPIGTESPRDIHAFIKRLDGMLPGIRLKERLSQLSIVSHQSIIDFLGTNGYLNSRILANFRASEVRWITLTESLTNAGGLNLCDDILPTFNQPNSFVFVSELCLRDIHIHDFDLTQIQHLPRLSTLLLDNTSISNEATFHLVPLKRTLTQLSIGSNPAINDEAVPALLLLSKLTFLSILDTSVLMPGLRRLAGTIHDEQRAIDIEIPSACEEYVRGLSLLTFLGCSHPDNCRAELDKRYELDPCPPLIVVPEVCVQLSAAALQRNLAAHKVKNPDILAAGSKFEMAERLRLILETRRMDLLVRAMIFGSEGTSMEQAS